MKKFDIFIISAAAAVLLMAFIFYPSEKINFKRTTLMFSQCFDSAEQREVLDKIVAEFEEGHPGITITSVYRPYQGIKNDCAYYFDVMPDEQNLESNNGELKFPDIVSIDPLWFDDSAKRILFKNQNSLETADFGVKNEEYSKHLYSYFNALFYNIGILEDAGFDRPPKTRDEFAAVCLKLKEKNIYGLSVGGNFFTDIFPWIWPEAGKNALQDINREKDTFDFTGANVVESIDFFNKLNTRHILGRPPFIKNEDEKINNFLAGKTAMVTASSKLIKLLETEHKSLRFGITSIPYTESPVGRPVFNMNSIHAAVLSTSPYEKEAFEFIEFLAERRAELAVAAGAVSEDSSSSVFEYSRTASSPDAASVYVKAQNLIESAEGIEDWKIFSASASLNSIAGEEISLMLTHNRGAEETALEIKKRYDSIIE
ncbi:MAG: extracellular solute-binding protein [Spirochaetaceae bacterium]|jgi:multiple sugar transport system substrate-binding protein|nr:extracellular solute-binding protein [Spirochaetaceae bacterium]